jgi:hypothetical protein
MPLILGSAFLAGALLSCVLPISLLIVFATFFIRSVRRLPPNAAPGDGPPTTDEGHAHAAQQLSDIQA